MNVAKRHIILLLLLVAGLLAGCTNTPEPPQPEAPDEICLNADVQKVQKGAKASTISNASGLQGEYLRIDAYFHGTTANCIDNAKLKYITSAWKFVDGSDAETHYYWPIEGSVHEASGETVGALDFVGYCPYDLTHTGVTLGTYSTGNPQMTCTLPMVSTTPEGEETTQANLKEFLWAYTGNQTKSSNSGTVNMTFKHPFARIRFQLSENHPDIVIKTITLKALKSGGTCSFDGSISTWSALTPSEGTVDFVASPDQTCNDNPASPVTIGTDYILVPQTFAGNIEVKAEWIDWGEMIEHTLTTKIDAVDWDPGTSYTYTFTITETDLVVNTTKFTEQW